MKTLTLEDLRSNLAHFGGLLRQGSGGDYGYGQGYGEGACVRELRAYSLGRECTDHPDGALSLTDNLAIALNDSPWSCAEVCTEACLPLGLLSDATAREDWIGVVADRFLREIIPRFIRDLASTLPEPRRAAMMAMADECEAVGTTAVVVLGREDLTWVHVRIANDLRWARRIAAKRPSGWARQVANIVQRAIELVGNSLVADSLPGPDGDGDAILRQCVQIVIDAQAGVAPTEKGKT